MKMKAPVILSMVILAIMSSACDRGTANLKQIEQKQSGEYIVTLLNDEGQLKNGRNRLVLEFRKTSDNQLVDVGDVQAVAAMTGMNMSSETTIEKTDTPGRYDLNANLSMAGRWDFTVTFAGGQSVRFSPSAL